MATETYFSAFAPNSANIAEAIQIIRDSCLLPPPASSEPLILRIFCSDVYNQAPLIEKLWPAEPGQQRIYLGQTPLDSAYISLQAYSIAGATNMQSDGNGCLFYRHGAYESLWTLDYPG